MASTKFHLVAGLPDVGETGSTKVLLVAGLQPAYAPAGVGSIVPIIMQILDQYTGGSVE